MGSDSGKMREGMQDTQIDMTKVTRYKCRWCGREFRTSNRHKCRFNPAYRSCLSCKHCGKFDSFEEEDWNVPAECVADGVFRQPIITIKGFRCLRDAPNGGKGVYEVGEGGYNDFPYAVYGAISDGRGCVDWEIMEGYIGSKTFAKRQREME